MHKSKIQPTKKRPPNKSVASELDRRKKQKEIENKQKGKIIIAFAILSILVVLSVLSAVWNLQPKETPSHIAVALNETIGDSQKNEETVFPIEILDEDGILGLSSWVWIIFVGFWIIFLNPFRRRRRWI